MEVGGKEEEGDISASRRIGKLSALGAYVCGLAVPKWCGCVVDKGYAY